jgi:hypothetical protein
MLVAYAKQETLGPFRGLLRSVAFGVAGSVAMSGGVVLLLVALLRLLQDDTGTAFEGHLSWLPYVITLIVALATVGLVAWWIVAGRGFRAGDGKQAGRRSGGVAIAGRRSRRA